VNSNDAEEQPTDLIIIGAGAAGLSLLLALKERNYRHTVKVLERQNGPQHDRIWSFWNNKDLPIYIKAIISHEWSRWSLSTEQHQYTMRDSFYPYCSIRSEHLGALAIEHAEQETNVEIIFNCDVLSIDCNADRVFITTANGTMLAKKVVDTRPPPLHQEHNGLFQCFYGEEISINADILEPFTVKLMDQLRYSELGIEFVYVLPFSSNHALVEFTCFSITIIDKETLKARLTERLKHMFEQHDYKVLRTEQAALPMYSINHNNLNKTHKNLIYGGIAGGAMRIATGFSFLNSQRWAKQCAQALIEQGKLVPSPPINLIYRTMDALMIRVLRNDMKIGVTIFEQMFKKVKAKRFARFMTEQATTADMISVIAAMPKRAFLRAAYNALTAAFTTLLFKRKQSPNKHNDRQQ
jgi:lycopene beta-cyclase